MCFLCVLDAVRYNSFEGTVQLTLMSLDIIIALSPPISQETLLEAFISNESCYFLTLASLVIVVGQYAKYNALLKNI
jgi:hypothetical protein